MKIRFILQNTFIALTAISLLSSCFETQKDEVTPAPATKDAGKIEDSYLNNATPCDVPALDLLCGNTTTVDLMAGQFTDAGDIQVVNDNVNMYVTYATTGGWKLKAVQLYVGACASIPKNGGGNPMIGQFPYKQAFTIWPDSYTFAIPLDNLSGCVCVAAHAEVVLSGNGGTRTETGWGKGEAIGKGSWAMSFNYCVQTCVQTALVDTEGCSLSQGYWFAKPNLVWTRPVTVAGRIYTQAEGKAIWETSNAGGIPDSKACFTQVAAIRLSGVTVLPTASVWRDVAIAENYLSSLGKLSPTNLPTGNQAAKEAAGRIGEWINTHHCQ